MTDSRRERIYQLTERDVVALLALVGRMRVALGGEPPLPAGSEISGVVFDYHRRVLDVIARSPEFEEVKPGFIPRRDSVPDVAGLLDRFAAALETAALSDCNPAMERAVRGEEKSHLWHVLKLVMGRVGG